MAKKASRLDEIEARVRDMMQNHGKDIESNSFLRFPASLIADMDYLVRIARGKAPADAGEDDGQ